MANDEPSAPSAEGHPDGPPSSVAGDPLPRTRLWPFLLALLLAVGGGGYGVWRWWTAPDPLKVLVAVELDGAWWEGGAAATRLADGLARKLTNLGFEVVRGDEPAVVEQLTEAESPVAAARSVGASFVVAGRLAPEVEELPVAGGLVEARIDGSIDIQHIDDSQPSSSTQLRCSAQGDSREQAVVQLGEELAAVILDRAVPVLLHHAVIEQLHAGKDPAVQERLVRARNFVKAHNARWTGMRDAYEQLAKERLAEEKGPRPPRFISPPDASERLVAAAAQGVLVASSGICPFYTIDGDFETLPVPDVVAWRDHEGGEAAVLWRGHSAFTYPSAAPAGAPVVLTANWYGRARAVTAIDGPGSVRRLRADERLRYSEPRVAPGGRLVALAEIPCRRCPRSLIVLDLSDAQGREVFRVGPPTATRLGRFGWLDERQLMVIFTPAVPPPKDGDEDDESEGAPKQTLWRVDVTEPAPALHMLLEASPQFRLSDPAASPDGRRVVVSLGAHQAALATFELQGGVPSGLVRHDVGGPASAPRFGPAGDKVVFELLTSSGYPEIAVLQLAGSRVEQLTRNESPDRHPLFSADGATVYYEARNRDPIFGPRRSVSRVAAVPVTP